MSWRWLRLVVLATLLLAADPPTVLATPSSTGFEGGYSYNYVAEDVLAAHSHRAGRLPDRPVEARARGDSRSGEVRLRLAADSSAPSGARIAGETSDVLLNSSRQLQSKFKHASDFGVQGNYNPANASRFSEALNQHINSPLTTAIEGTYRGNPVTPHLDPATGLNVIADSGGNFVSGWKLGAEQLQNVLTHGGLN